MKTIARSLLFLGFALATSFARAEEPVTHLPIDVVEEGAPEASVAEGALGQLEIKVGKATYLIEPAQDQTAYESLTEQDRVQFARNRRVFLTQAARAMSVFKFGLGTGSIVNGKLRYAYRAVRRREQDPKSELKFRERSELVVGNLLQALDRTLWPQAALLTRANEFGVVASVGAEALGGFESRGWGGLFDVGISIGYNAETRAIAIQLYTERERYKSTVMKAVFVAGVLLKAGPYVANQRESLGHSGSSFYPPGVPAYSSITNDSFATGFSSGLTIPPSPIGDLLTYTNTLKQDVVLRIEVSPFLKGFVRVKSGVAHAVVRTSVETVSNAIRAALNLRSAKTPALTCSALFS